MAIPHIRAEASGQVNGGPQQVYDFFREVDLTLILTGRGPLPAVTSVDDPVGRWDAPGQERILHLADGGQLRERLTRLDPPHSFEYEIDQITGPLGRLVERMFGCWSFEPELEASHDGPTLACWHYTFAPRSRLALAPSFVVIRSLWQPYMRRVLATTKALAERHFVEGG